MWFKNKVTGVLLEAENIWEKLYALNPDLEECTAPEFKTEDNQLKEEVVENKVRKNKKV